MNQYVDLNLDRPRRFTLTPSDWRSAARQTSLLLGMPVSTTRLTVLVGEDDDTAIAAVISAGCRHEDPKFGIDKAHDVLDARKERGEDREDIGEAILNALRAIGVLRRQPDAETNGAPDPNVPSSSQSLT